MVIMSKLHVSIPSFAVERALAFPFLRTSPVRIELVLAIAAFDGSLDIGRGTYLKTRNSLRSIAMLTIKALHSSVFVSSLDRLLQSLKSSPAAAGAS